MTAGGKMAEQSIDFYRKFYGFSVLNNSWFTSLSTEIDVQMTDYSIKMRPLRI